ncbi:MAG: NAD(P)-dependent oxidoreductase [Alphaproteobacteria bacterium]|nr:NAD(P)-dependent oxidoreductase [Alphaproteobacteria bacterium]
MAIVVTGASGFVGLNVVEHLLRQGRRVVALSHDAIPGPAQATYATLPGELTAVAADIADPATLADLFRRHRVEGAIHLAAVTAAADAPPTQATRVLDVNVVGTLALFEAARDARLRRVVYASSGAVYGDGAFRDPPPDEANAPEPTSLYGLTKLLGERLMLRFRAAHGLDAVAARLGAVFGPWERDTGLRATLSPPYQIARLAAGAGEARLLAGYDRDWIYSRDIARAIVLLLDAPRLGHAVYNVTAGIVWDARLVAEAMALALPGFAWRVADDAAAANIRYHSPPGRARRSPRIDRIRTDLGYTPEFMPALAAADYAAWVARHQGYFA